MRVRAIHTFAAFERDATRVPVKVVRQAAKAVRTRAEQGNRNAKNRARNTAGKHGRHYPNSFLAEAISPLEWQYGPHPSLAQGEMSFEYGSRNQPPHMDLNKSADVVGPKLAADMGRILDDLY